MDSLDYQQEAIRLLGKVAELTKRLAVEHKLRIEYQDIVYQCCNLIDSRIGLRITIDDLVSKLKTILGGE